MAEFEYPRRRPLAFLVDPTLYFSWLPKDIRQYCLAPLLSTLATSFLCAENWIQPVLVKRIYLPQSHYNYFLVSSNGHFLFWNKWDRQLILLYPNTQVRWVVPNVDLISLRYSHVVDFLLIKCLGSDGQFVYQRINQISQITSREEFTASVKTISASDYAETPTGISSSENGPHMEKLKEIHRQIMKSFAGKLLRSWNMGGYILNIVREEGLVPAFTRLDFYQYSR